MKNNIIQVICGPGRGKSTAALGRGISALTQNQTVIMVQFLKGAIDPRNMEVIKRLESEFKLFRFEKTSTAFDQLSDEEKEEARASIRNGLNFARKVLTTGECDILILDEILGILDEGIISLDELAGLIAHARQMETKLVLTGTVYPAGLDAYVDEVTRIQTRYEEGGSENTVTC